MYLNREVDGRKDLIVTERIPPEKVIALILLGPKGMDQEHWVEPIIGDIF